MKPKLLKLKKVVLMDPAERDAALAKLTDDHEREVFTALESACHVLAAFDFQFNAVTTDLGQLLIGTATLIQRARAARERRDRPR
jgi:hypothetical protein